MQNYQIRAFELLKNMKCSNFGQFYSENDEKLPKFTNFPVCDVSWGYRYRIFYLIGANFHVNWLQGFKWINVK
jgi:hypothetical protein